MDRAKQSKRRIFLGLREVAGYYSQLQQGLRALGYVCRAAQSRAHGFAYPLEMVRFPLLGPLARLHRSSARCRFLPARLAMRLIWFIGWQILRWPLFVWAACCHEVFILRAMVPFLPGYLELPILRCLGRRIVMTYHGTESRPAFMNGKLMRRAPWFVRYVVPVICWAQRRAIGYADRFCHVIVEHTATGMYHRKPFLMYLCAGVPVDTSSPPVPHRSDDNGPLKALHCPSYTRIAMKGSPEIRAAVEAVRRQGLDVELVELAGQPNQVVLDAIDQCDVVIDEVWSDTPMAHFAAEAASRGRGTIVGGYYREILTEETPAEAIPPSCFVAPDGLAEAIAELARDRQRCRQLGQDAFAYVREHWRASEVVRRILDALDGSAPEEWFFRPEDCRYAYGYGMSQETYYEHLADLVGRWGTGVLQLHGRPRVLEAIEAFLTQHAQKGATSD